MYVYYTSFMTELKIIYVSQNEDSSILYLYDNANKVILPIESDITVTTDSYICIIKSILSILNIKQGSFEIYKHQDETFYWYLKIRTSKKTYKINCDSELFSYLVQKINFPVYAPEKILQKQGIRVTEELLEYGLVS